MTLQKWDVLFCYKNRADLGSFHIQPNVPERWLNVLPDSLYFPLDELAGRWQQTAFGFHNSRVDSGFPMYASLDNSGNHNMIGGSVRRNDAFKTQWFWRGHTQRTNHNVSIPEGSNPKNSTQLVNDWWFGKLQTLIFSNSQGPLRATRRSGSRELKQHLLLMESQETKLNLIISSRIEGRHLCC